MIQKTISDSREIYNKNISMIEGATNSIKIASAWFTDPTIFEALYAKLDSSELQLEIILDDNKENFNLPFQNLQELGATVKVLKGKGNTGMMHAKFLIFDDKALISGSYNLSNNAKNNNQETVIYTEHADTIHEHINVFNKLLNEATLFENNQQVQEVNTPKEEVMKVKEATTDFKSVLNELVFAQVHSYDRDELKSLGFSNSKNCQGHAENVANELDHVYTSLLNDVSISEDRQKLIKNSIIEQRERSLAENELEKGYKIAHLQNDHSHDLAAVDQHIVGHKKEMETVKSEMDHLSNVEIKDLERQISAKKEKIQEIERDVSKPKIQKYKFIPALSILGLVIVYSFCFYSSAAYILFNATDEAKNANRMGQVMETPHIFDSMALQKALDHGLGNLIFICLFPVILMGILYFINVAINTKWQKYTLILSIIFMVDGFIAYAVSSSIHEIEYMFGNTDVVWEVQMAFFNSNFYLVLIFGLLGLLCYEFILGYVLSSLDKVNGDAQFESFKKIKGLIELEIEAFTQKINVAKESLTNKEAINSNLKNQLALLEDQRLNLLKNHERTVLNTETKYNTEASSIQNITDIYLTKIDNETFTFSSHFIKERIAIFLSGWKDFLHSYYAYELATEISIKVDDEAKKWKNTHLSNTVSK